MHDKLKKIQSGDRESIALILLDAPDRPPGEDTESPEDYAMSLVKKSEKEKDPLKVSILEALEPMGLPPAMQKEVCKVIYEALKSGNISLEEQADEDPVEEESTPDESEEADY
jgi:hypothetical protein